MSDDPLGVKELALSFDYLMFRINDHVKSVSEETFIAVSGKDKLVKEDYLENQLRVKDQIESIDSVIAQCDALEGELVKLDQLGGFVEEFGRRVAALEKLAHELA